MRRKHKVSSSLIAMPRARAAAYCSAAPGLLAAGAVLSVFLPPLLAGDIGAAGPATTTTKTVVQPVKVGVILDLATGLGKKSLLSLEMALEDLYAAHPGYTTRVELHVRDSDRDVVTAASAGISSSLRFRPVPMHGSASAHLAEFAEGSA